MLRLVELTEISNRSFVEWLGLARGKFYDWKRRYGKVNEHNGKIPRDHWLADDEKKAIIAYHDAHPLDGYRRLSFMMLDDDVAAASPSSVYRVLRDAGVLDRSNRKKSKKKWEARAPLPPMTPELYMNPSTKICAQCSIPMNAGRGKLCFECWERNQ